MIISLMHKKFHRRHLRARIFLPGMSIVHEMIAAKTELMISFEFQKSLVASIRAGKNRS
jgi:hypothetical protein